MILKEVTYDEFEEVITEERDFDHFYDSLFGGTRTYEYWDADGHTIAEAKHSTHADPKFFIVDN